MVLLVSFFEAVHLASKGSFHKLVCTFVLLQCGNLLVRLFTNSKTKFAP